MTALFVSQKSYIARRDLQGRTTPQNSFYPGIKWYTFLYLLITRRRGSVQRLGEGEIL